MIDMGFDDRQIEAAQAQMESKRSAVDGDCVEIAAMLLPEAEFQARGYRMEGVSRSALVYDDDPAEAFQDAVSVFEGFTMPKGQKWQKTRVADEGLIASVANLQWLEAVDGRVFAHRMDPESGFVANIHASAENLLSMWGQSMWVDKRFDAWGRYDGLSYQAEDVSGIWIERDAAGNIMRIHRMVTLTAEQAKAKWEENTPPKVVEAMSGANPQPDREFEFLHVIERNPRIRTDVFGPQSMPWRACYYSRADTKVFLQGGYRTLRRIVSCYSRKAGRDYGRSPAMRLLRALRASNILMQDRVMGVEMSLKPSLLAPDDDLDEAIIGLGPWGITYGGLDESLRPRLQRLMEQPDMTDAAVLHAEIRAIYRKGFFGDLLQLRREMKTHVSATRIMEEIAEKGVLLAPLANQETEWFAPMLDVELDLMGEEGELDDMPPALAEYFGRGMGVRVKYDNPLRQMMLAAEAAGYLRTAEQVSVLAQFDQDAVPMFKREYPLDKVIPGLGEANGIPARWRSTDDEKAEADAAAAQQKMLQQIVEAGPAIGQAAERLANAGAAGGA